VTTTDWKQKIIKIPGKSIHSTNDRARQVKGKYKLIKGVKTKKKEGGRRRKENQPETAVASNFVKSSVSILPFSPCGNVWNTSYTLLPFESRMAPSRLPATAPAMAPGKFLFLPQKKKVNQKGTRISINHIVQFRYDPLQPQVAYGISIYQRLFPSQGLQRRLCSSGFIEVGEDKVRQVKEKGRKRKEEHTLL